MHLYIDDAIPDQRLEKYTHLDRRRLVREGGGGTRKWGGVC